MCYRLFAVVVVDSGTREGVIVLSNADTSPLVLRACVVDVFEGGAPVERTVANARDSIADSYTRKAVATVERKAADACNAFGNSYAPKAVATRERGIADARDAFGNRYARKA